MDLTFKSTYFTYPHINQKIVVFTFKEAVMLDCLSMEENLIRCLSNIFHLIENHVSQANLVFAQLNEDYIRKVC